MDISGTNRWRTTRSKRKQMERKAELNKKYRKVPVNITRQPKKSRNRWVGRVTYEWVNGPKRGQKVSCPITLKEPARLSIRGKDLLVIPRGGEQYVWGEKGHNPPVPDQEKIKQWKRSKRDTHDKREKRLRDALLDRFRELLAKLGPHEAGRRMATAFVRAHNRLDSREAKLALAKLYGSVVRTSRAAHIAFGRQIRKAHTLTEKAAQQKKVAAALRQAAEALENQ